MQKKFSMILLVALFAGMLIFANTKGFLDGAKKSAYDFSAPVGVFFSERSNGASRFFGGIFALGKLQKENGILRDQVNRLQAEVAQLSEAKKENVSLKKDLGFKTKNNFSYEPAEVIAFDPAMLRGTVLINKGSKDGLKVGMAAISEGFLAGKVLEVSESTAKVQLVTDPQSAIPATIQSTNTNGIVRGEIGFGMVLEKVPQGDPVKVGDMVITSGLGGEMPKGLVMGKIEKIESEKNSLFITANVRPSADLRSLYRLIIIKNQ